ncbi:unnamed protein product, partial [Didymodactylos carnosus]
FHLIQFPEKGRVLIADRNFKIGEIVFEEKALIIWDSDITLTSNPYKMFLELKIDERDQILNEFYYPGDNAEALNKAEKFIDDLIENKTLELPQSQNENKNMLIKFECIMQINGHTITDERNGLFRTGSKLTHSCTPNISYEL